ncbi:MAG: ABC transporter permease, partial [Planctomycetia bacterium]|nr:ABC transporter permease [Planctomycetia bacterium]
EYKDLFYFLVLRDVMALYKQTILGFSWAILRPFITMIIFQLVFSNLAKISTDGSPGPIFYYSGLVPWMYFSNSLTKSTNSLISGAGMFTKVYFPRLVLPIVPCLASLVDFVIAMTITFILLIVYGLTPTIWILFLPLLILLMFLTAAGLGLWLSALAIQYRDVPYGVQFLVSILMWVAPIIWSTNRLSAEYRIYYGLYPMAGVIEGFRSALYGLNPMPWDLIGMGYISAIFLFITGAYYFKNEKNDFSLM